MTNRLLQVGEVAKRTGVSVRTLHYYDEKGLLRPSHRSEAGYRLYTLDDLVQLQKIKSLQQLGMSLDEILALSRDEETCIISIINSHVEFLQQQIKRQSKVANRLQRVVGQLVCNKKPTIKMLIDALQETVTYEKYFSEQQLENLDKRKSEYDLDYFKQAEKEWTTIFEEFRLLLDKNVDSNLPEAQALAARAQKLINAFTGDDEGITMYESEAGSKALKQQDVDVDEKTFDFYTRAMEVADKE